MTQDHRAVRAARTPRRVARLGTALGSLVTAVVVAGCAATTTGVPGALGAPAPVGGASPQAVGLAYGKALFTGDFTGAAAYVRPQDQGMLKLITTGLSQASVRAERLAVGSVAIHGDSATVVLTGRICSSGAAPKAALPGASRPNEECLENSNPHTTNPAFGLTLCKSAASWFVCFPSAPATTAPTGTASPQAAASASAGPR